ncbi:hypothetical protein LJC48_01675 [Desulfovibrio sp. OttesenSCG-928-C06]|nr:hypothetical protein [Desulfovibrio sp. OttesenSCG-928-C06]
MLSRLLDEEECRMRRERDQSATGEPAAEQTPERSPSAENNADAGNEPDA